MSIISAGNTTTTAIVVTGDTTGNLVFATGGANTTALTLSNTQAATFANNVSISGALTTTGAVTQTGNASFSANVSVAGSVNALNTFGFKNRIINGDMRIDQRNAGASVTLNGTNNVYPVDRFASYASIGTVTGQQSSVAPSGFINSILYTVTSSATVGASDRVTFAQFIEGLNIADLGWGTANAKPITLSFWVRSSLTGTFGGALKNSANDRAYPFSYTISAANTWEYETITIAGDTTGTWLTTNGVGVRVVFGLGVGSTLSTTANAWTAGNYWSTTGATSVVGTSGATFYITGVQLEVGSQATSFDFRDYGRELILCQRYAQLIKTGGAGICPASTICDFVFYFPVQMRTAATISTSTALTITDSVATNYTQSSANISEPIGANNGIYLYFRLGNFTGLTSYRPMFITSLGTQILATAEL